MTNIDGLSSGLDTTTIINQLMSIERRPQNALITRRDQEQAARTELSEIRNDVTALRTSAADLRLTTGWNRLTAASSNEEAVSVQATAASTTGSYTFQVSSIATAAAVYSTQEFASLDDATGATGPSVFNATGYTVLGFSSLSGTGFADGSIPFEVTQSSEAAEVQGVGIPAIPITIDGTNDSIDLEVNGFNFSVTLTHDTYDSEQALADALQAAIASDSGLNAVAKASLGASNEIVISTKSEGSANGLTVTGGTALGALGLAQWATGSGVDGIVEVDGTASVITDTTSGSAVTLPSGGSGSIEAVVSGGLRAGTATVSQSTSGAGSLSELVSSLNAADLGYTAYAVNTGTGYRLQLTADETGADSTIDTDPAIFGAMGFTVLSDGTDAELTIEGDNPLTITSSSNTFDELLPGVAVTINSVTTAPVTVSTERDVAAVTESVSELVTKMNELFSRIATSTNNDPNSERAVLQGNREARRVADQLRSTFVAAMDDNPFTSVGLVGIELNRDGSLTFNEQTFTEAFISDPAALTELFASSNPADESVELGALDRLIDVAESATAVGEGYLYTAGESADRLIDDYGRQIDAFEQRLELREATLRRTYANLEVALGGLQQQSSYLASQLGSLGGTA
ncbi:MAG: flagellar filament capping protein FliD [Acidimicrobiales bacterium]